MTYGFARCSTTEERQDIQRQIRELKAAGAEQIVFDYEHGDAPVKKNQNEMFERVTAGDTILVTEISRLTRSVQQLCEIIKIIESRNLRLIVIGSISIDCRSGEIDPMSRAFIQMSGVFAELELSMTRARVRSGMRNAKAKGVKLGRPETTRERIPEIFFRHYPLYSSGAITKAEFARLCDLSRPTLDKYISISESGDVKKVRK